MCEIPFKMKFDLWNTAEFCLEILEAVRSAVLLTAAGLTAALTAAAHLYVNSRQLMVDYGTLLRYDVLSIRSL